MSSVIHVIGEVRIICTDRKTHPSRELAPPLEIRDDPEWRKILHADGELTGEEAEWLYQNERTLYWTRRSKRGGEVEATKVEIGQTQPDHVDLEIGDPGDGQGFLWRFKCPTCHRDLPLRTNKLNRILESHVKAGLRSLDISTKPSILRRLEQMS
jgi:hypothetical protein